TLTPPTPNFALPADYSDLPSHKRQLLVRELDRARNQYDYALKVRELSRLVNIAANLRNLANDLPGVPELHLLIAQLLIRSGRYSDARLICETVWRSHHLAEAAYSAAYCALSVDDRASACRLLV